MPSIASKQTSYFTHPATPPITAHDSEAPALPPMRLPPSPEDSDSSDSPRRPVLIFSDFDGTIVLGDSGHVLFDAHGCGVEKRKELDAAIHSGELSFRDASEQMWGSLNVPFEDGFEVMKDRLEIDPAFQEFHDFCIERKIPFNVISAGIKPVLRRVLDEFVGEQAQHIDIVANDAHISEDGSEWKIVWKDDTSLGHDKAASIQAARSQATEDTDDEPPLIIFIGDGVSDLPAARECDVLFARRGLRLEEYCIEHNIPYIPFDTFKDIEREVAKIIKDDRKSKKESGIPKFYNPRANFWRRISSRQSVPSLRDSAAAQMQTPILKDVPNFRKGRAPLKADIMRSQVAYSLEC